MNIDKKIKKFIKESVNKKVFPAVSIGICFNDENSRNKSIILSGNFNKNNKIKSLNKKVFFDLASLTKPLATVLSILSLTKEKKINIDDDLKSIIINKKMSDIYSSITIKQLLSHSSGLPAHRNYFKEIVKVSVGKRKEFIFNLLLNEPLSYKPGCKVQYSDLGYMLLGFIIEKISGIDLDSYFKKMIMEPIGLEENIFFNPLGSEKHCGKQFAAVEECPWRGRLLQGEVSDENCWALGGVAGHAGLYGDISGVLDLTELILDIWLGRRNHPNIDRLDLISFLQRRSGPEGNTWALGFDTPTPGKSSSGKYLSTTSVGHLGFTGTSFWIDPERELVIVILSNRVHPSRDNELIKQFRPAFHDKVVEWLGLQSV
ncbi:MAG: serine hydrolase [Thermodesulfobacteriota bacterium]